MLRIFVAGFVAMAFALGMAVAADKPSFQVGQKWTVKDGGLTIVVGRIEPFTGGKNAVHVSVFDVPCPPSMGCATTIVAHAPFDEEALASSVDRLVATGAATAPGFKNGYAQWQQAHGGVFTVPVSDLPKLLFATMMQRPR